MGVADLIWIAVVLAAGCASIPGRGPDGRAEFARLKAAKVAVVPYSAALAPVVIEVPKPKEGAENYTPILDADHLRKGISDVLEEYHVFENLVLLPSRLENPDVAELLQKAAKSNADVLLLVTFRREEFSYVGTNKWFLPATALSGLLWFPQWLVADEIYAGDGEIEVSVYSVPTRDLIDKVRIAGHAEGALDEIAKGWSMGGTLLNMPGSLAERNWKKVADAVGPAADGDLHANLLDYLTVKLKGIGERDVEKFAKRGAVIVGISTYADARVPPVESAVKDARDLYELLASQHGVIKANADLLLDGDATKAGLEQSLRYLAEHSRAGDASCVYFAGRAARGADGKAYLLPQDANPDDLPGTAISLDALRETLNGVRGHEVLVLCDASFSGAAESRSWAPGAVEPATDDLVRAALPAGRGRIIYSASRADEGAWDKEGRGHGLFTFFLLDALRGRADKDADKVVTMKELTTFVDQGVSAQAALAGRAQHPLLLLDGEIDLAKGWLDLGR